MVDDAPPAVEPTHDGTDGPALGLGDQEQIGIMLPLLADFLRCIGAAKVNARPGRLPQRQNAGPILPGEFSEMDG
jgi:hypothetical protein